MMTPKQIGKVYTHPTFTASGPMTLPSPVETYRMILINQTSSGSFTTTLPTPTDTSVFFAVDVINVGTISITVNDRFIGPSKAARFGYGSGGWVLISAAPFSEGYAVSGRYDPVADGFSAQLFTSYTTLPVASPANAGQVFELSDDVSSTGWASPNATGANASLGDWIISDGTAWTLWRNQNVRIGQGDQLASATAPTVRNTDHALRNGDFWYNTVRNDVKVYDAASTAWLDINDPVTVMNGSLYTSTKSQSYFSNDPNDELELNATPQDGEHVRIHIQKGAECWVDPNGSTAIDALGNVVTTRTYDGDAYSMVEYIYDATNANWRIFTKAADSGTFNVIGFYRPSQDRWYSIDGTFRGPLPVGPEYIGAMLIIEWEGEASDWTATNIGFAPIDYNAGDALTYDQAGVWVYRYGSSRVMLHQIYSDLTPTKRTNRHALEDGDLWIHRFRKDMKSRVNGVWEDVNDPVTEMSNGTHTSTRSESFHCNDGNANALFLNASPVAGEHVRLYVSRNTTCSVDGNTHLFEDESGANYALHTFLGNTDSILDFVWDDDNGLWKLFKKSATSSSAPSYRQGTLAARGSGIVDGDLYTVTGDPDPNEDGKTYSWEAATSTWILLDNALFGTGTLAARPVSEADGFIYFATNTNQTFVYDDANSVWRTIGTVGVTSSTNPSTDNRVARYDGTTGQIIQQGNMTIDDAGNVSFVASFDYTGRVTARTTTVPSNGNIICNSNFNVANVPMGTVWNMFFSSVPASGIVYMTTLILTLAAPAANVTWPASVRWPDGLTPSLASGRTHIITFLTTNGGVTWYATVQANYA